MSTKGKTIGRRSFLGMGAAAAGLGLWADLEAYPQNVNRNSIASDLKITDMRIAVLRGPGGEPGRKDERGPRRGPMPPATPGAGAAAGGTIVVRIDTNQGISGYGQTIGDGPQPNYVLMHKARLLGENPCNVDRIFRKIKMHGGYNRQGSGVNAIENALWDLAGQAYGVPIYQMLGGKFRDKVRMYSEGDPRSNSIEDIAADYKERVASGFTMLKYDLPVVPILRGKPGTIFAPKNYNGEPGDVPPENYYTGLEISDKGCELVADHVAAIKEAMGPAGDVPMGHDHFGHLTVKSCIKLANALERVNPSTLEDMVPWFRVQEWKLITDSIKVSTLTGEDAYLVESLEPLCQARAVDYIHPDHLVIGGCLELKKTSDMAAQYSVGMMVHSNATPIGYAAGVHAIAACENFLAMEWHQPQPAWHKELTDKGDLVVQGYIPVPTGPGLGIKVNEEAMRHLCRQGEFFTDPTTYWDSQVGGEKTYT